MVPIADVAPWWAHCWRGMRGHHCWRGTLVGPTADVALPPQFWRGTLWAPLMTWHLADVAPCLHVSMLTCHLVGSNTDVACGPTADMDEKSYATPLSVAFTWFWCCLRPLMQCFRGVAIAWKSVALGVLRNAGIGNAPLVLRKTLCNAFQVFCNFIWGLRMCVYGVVCRVQKLSLTEFMNCFLFTFPFVRGDLYCRMA